MKALHSLRSVRTVMAGLVPPIHVFPAEGVDARHKAGHDERI
jgi:hypothetical protein